MSFDASRFPFDPWNDFAGVVMQQGRVQLDSDWNEWLAILNRRIQAGTMDTVGRAVYPLTTPFGFKIGASTDANGVHHMTIGAGRMYVDGILAEAADSTTYLNQPDGYIDPDKDKLPDGSYIVYLRVTERGVTYLQDPDIREVALGIHGPDTTGRTQVVWQIAVWPAATTRMSFGRRSAGSAAIRLKAARSSWWSRAEKAKATSVTASRPSRPR